jgi:hypothetical protein
MIRPIRQSDYASISICFLFRFSESVTALLAFSVAAVTAILMTM